MKLSTRSTYGLRAMMAVAANDGQDPIMVKEIAERYQLPATYLEQIMVPLRKSGLLLATRGARGGYRLSRPARDITLHQIIQTLEGSLELVDCNDITCCGLQPEQCALKDVLTEAGQAMMQILDGITLADLVERQRAKETIAASMYVI